MIVAWCTGHGGRREAIRQLDDLRRRLAVAEDALADALAAMKRAEEAFDAASDRFDAARRAPSMWTARHEPRHGRSATRPGKRMSGPAPMWTGYSGGSASCPAAWTGC